MAGLSKLFGTLIMSVPWAEDSDTTKVYVTLLGMADKNGKVDACLRAVSNTARLSDEQCKKSLENLKQPKYNEPAQITEIPEGWQIAKFKEIWGIEREIRRREYLRIKQADYRQEGGKK